jgi:hypothetical protein
MTKFDRISPRSGCAELVPQTLYGEALISSAAVPRVNSPNISGKDNAALFGVLGGGVAVNVDYFQTLEYELIELRSWVRS